LKRAPRPAEFVSVTKFAWAGSRLRTKLGLQVPVVYRDDRFVVYRL